jgi:hypothetical protein
VCLRLRESVPENAAATVAALQGECASGAGWGGRGQQEEASGSVSGQNFPGTRGGKKEEFPCNRENRGSYSFFGVTPDGWRDSHLGKTGFDVHEGPQRIRSRGES